MRRADQKRLEAIWRTVEENPGVKAGRVMRALPAMEEEGLLLSEDERGGLWSWGRRRRS